MAQNIYDSCAFFEEYCKYPRAQDGLKGASEWPILIRMLPKNFNNSMTVLDLGCGDGWFSRWVVGQGAGKVVATDVSQNMLDEAQKRMLNRYDNITLRQADLDAINLETDTFDLVFSGLALHYVVDLVALLRKIHNSLKTGGSFVFSVEHPIFTAPKTPGFQERSSGKSEIIWALNDYFAEGDRTVSWLGASVQKQHRSLAAYINALLAVGFTLTGIDEWGTTKDEDRKHPNWPNEGVIPRFLLIKATK